VLVIRYYAYASMAQLLPNLHLKYLIYTRHTTKFYMGDYRANVICGLKLVISNYRINPIAWLIRLIDSYLYFAYYPNKLKNTNKFIEINDILVFNISIWYCSISRNLFFLELINIGMWHSLFSASSNTIIFRAMRILLHIL